MAINEQDTQKIFELAPENPLRKQAEMLLAGQNLTNLSIHMKNLQLASMQHQHTRAHKPHRHYARELAKHLLDDAKRSEEARTKAQESMANSELNKLLDEIQKQISALSQVQQHHKQATEQLQTLTQQAQQLKSTIASTKAVMQQMVQQIQNTAPFNQDLQKIPAAKIAQQAHQVCQEFNTIEADKKLKPEEKEKRYEKCLAKNFKECKFPKEELREMVKLHHAMRQKPEFKSFIEKDFNQVEKQEAELAKKEQQISQLKQEIAQDERKMLQMTEQLKTLTEQVKKANPTDMDTDTQKRLQQITAQVDATKVYQTNIADKYTSANNQKTVSGIPGIQPRPGNGKAAEKEEQTEEKRSSSTPKPRGAKS